MTHDFRLLRLGDRGQETPAVESDGLIYRLDAIAARLDGAFFSANGIATVAAALDAGELPLWDGADALRRGAPIDLPGKIVCIGVNYRAHADESEQQIPAEPVVFMKDPSTIVGPEDDVLIPIGSSKTDWEVELGVVIGAQTRYLSSAEQAMTHIAGYVLSHDVSEREFQLERGGQWDKGKSCETFNPLGPVLVPAAAIPDPQNLDLKLWVNGTPRQDGNTRDMIFNVAHIVWYLSQFMVLNPGDVINTGTPEGTALGLPGQPYLSAGDVVETEITGLGRTRNRLVQATR